MKKIKKALTLLLVFALVLSMTATAFAYDVDNVNEESTESTDATLAAKTKAIVIIPGILGSSLETTTGTKVWLNLINYGKMALTETGTSVNSIQSANYDNYGANNTYKTLYNALNDAYGSTFDVIFFDYDFRLSNTTAATKLATELSAYTEVVLVAHSMGGLVASKYLANSSTNRNKTTALISLGTPYAGAAKCIDVMETGDMISLNVLGLSISLFKNTIKDMSKNCYAAYQLLPTSNYYSITGSYPISVNGVNYSSATAQLQNTSWGKKSDGTVKPMFSTATTFHSSLFTSGVHVKNFNDVTSYTLAATGQDTISKVSFNSNYAITALTYSNAGDETVLQKSAGYGTPNYLYTGTTHTGMVSSSTVISRIKTIITAETGVAAVKSAAFANNIEISDSISVDDAIEIDPDTITFNERGWIESLDNCRINIYADSESTIMIDGVIALEENNIVYDSNGTKIGSVWELGDTGKKMYALYDGEYEVAETETATIEYMEDGYFEKVLEYSIENAAVSPADDATLNISIGSFATQNVECAIDNATVRSEVDIQPSHISTTEELYELNAD